jgi:hypothetical protein
MSNMLAALKTGGLEEFDDASVERFYVFAWEREYLAQEKVEMGEGDVGYLEWVQGVLQGIKTEMAARGLSERKFAYQSRQTWWQWLRG